MGDNGQGERLHQEDFCQALGIVPELNYQNEGGPDLQRCFELLHKATLTSLYDLLCTAVYPTLATKKAMKVGNTYRFSEVRKRH